MSVSVSVSELSMSSRYVNSMGFCWGGFPLERDILVQLGKVNLSYLGIYFGCLNVH